MKRYRRNQSELKIFTSVDSPQVRAAVNLVCAVERGEAPSMETLEVLSQTYLAAFSGLEPKKFKGYPFTLLLTKGRLPDEGFNPSDIVSAVIEIELRRLGKVRGSLEKAINHVKEVFVDIPLDGDPVRSIRRDWKKGKALVEQLSDSELAELVKPYEVV